MVSIQELVDRYVAEKVEREPKPARIIIDVRRIREFFDMAPKGSRTHVNSVIAVLGEDLGAALFAHHLREAQGAEVRVLERAPTPGTRKGQRLDRWFLVTWTDGRKVLYQAEIKNWSAQAIGGRKLSLEADEAELSAFCRNRWANQWDITNGTFNHSNVGKVFNPMKRPAGVEESVAIEPLVIYWYAIHPHGGPHVFFPQDVSFACPFKRVWIFSMSAYLRTLECQKLELEMPNTSARLGWLSELVKISD